jgi:hypothetical protein
LAQPPEINETFLREVDENLRRDRLHDMAKRHGGWLVGALILFLLASGGWIYWQQYQLQHAQRQVEQLGEIYKDIGIGKTTEVSARLDDLSKSGNTGVRASALFTRAALAIQQNDVKLATAKYRQIAQDDSLPKPYRDAGLIRETAMEFDDLQAQAVIARLQPFTKPGDPWFGSAGEMTAMALIKQGKTGEAGRLFAAIAKDKTVPDSLRERAVQIAASLGVDASAALGAPNQ